MTWKINGIVRDPYPQRRLNEKIKIKIKDV
jgi:hypothetical protein